MQTAAGKILQKECHGQNEDKVCKYRHGQKYRTLSHCKDCPFLYGGFIFQLLYSKAQKNKIIL